MALDPIAAAAAAAKSLQLYPTLCDPINGSSPGSSIPGILQARTLEWVAISFSMANRMGKGGSSEDFLLGLQNHCRQWLKPWNQEMIASWQETDDKTRHYVEKQSHYSADKGPYSQGYCLPSGHTELWELTIKKAECQRIDAFKLWCWRRLLKSLGQQGDQTSQS